MRIDKIDGKQDTEPFHDLESRTSLWVNVSQILFIRMIFSD